MGTCITRDTQDVVLERSMDGGTITTVDWAWGQGLISTRRSGVYFHVLLPSHPNDVDTDVGAILVIVNFVSVTHGNEKVTPANEHAEFGTWVGMTVVMSVAVNRANDFVLTLGANGAALRTYYFQNATVYQWPIKRSSSRYHAIFSDASKL